MSVRTSGEIHPKVRTNQRDGNGRDTREGALPLLPSGPGGVHVPASSRPQAVYIFSGEGGIRTHDTLSDIHAFQACAFSRSATSPASGERRIRTYGTVAGTPDFESGAFDHSASSPAIQFSNFRSAQALEETGQPLGALRLEHPGGNLETVVVRERIQIGEPAQRTGLRARGAVNDAVDPGQDHRADAHGARLE